MTKDQGTRGRQPATPTPLAAGMAIALATGLASAFSSEISAVSLAPSRAQTTNMLHPADTLPVTSCADDGSAGTLRSVIGRAVSGDTVDLSALTCSTITLTQGAIRFDVDDISVSGPSDGGLTIDGNDEDSVFVNFGTGTLSIDHLTLMHGHYEGQVNYVAAGGCIFSSGNIALTAVTVSSCSVGPAGANNNGYGGGVFASRRLTIASSTISGNIAQRNGGGVFAFGHIEVSNSTISGNTALSAGGGLFGASGLSLHNSTVAFNTGTYGGGGIFLGGLNAPAPDLQSSIVANNAATYTGFYSVDIGSPFKTEITGSNNLIVSSDQIVPSDTLDVDPQLMPLADNGGATKAHAPDVRSPVIDAGSNPDNLDFDQRGTGYPRLSGAVEDIGAFEVQFVMDLIFQNGFDP